MEPLDQFDHKSSSTEVLDQRKEDRAASFNVLLYVAGLLIVGIAFVRSWPSATEVEISKLNQQRIELLEILQNSSTEEEREQAARSYEQLTRQVEQLESTTTQ